MEHFFRQKWHYRLFLVFGWLMSMGFVALNALAKTEKQSSTIAQQRINGVVTAQDGTPLSGVTVTESGTSNSTSTDGQGSYSLTLNNAQGAQLSFKYLGYKTQDVAVTGTRIDVVLSADETSLDEVVVVGYGTQKKSNITGSMATVSSKELGRVKGGSTVSTTLAGKLPGVSFRQADGRPGSGATIQIRNMGAPLYVIDGVQQDAGQFNNLAPDDIESITVLKDASAAIYGMRAANGVILVTTKKGTLEGVNRITANAKAGFRRLTRYFDVLDNSYDFFRYKAEAERNDVNPQRTITEELVEKYRQGTEYGYQSFDWKDFIIKDNAPFNDMSLNFTGGSDRINYYAALTNLYETAVFGRQYQFNRTNLQSNISARIAEGLKVGVNINGRIESRQNPGVPEADDYIQPLFAVIRNKPHQRPFANDNPQYLNDIGHNQTNWGYLNEDLAGKFRSDWRVLQTNFEAEYALPWVKGLKVQGLYSYYFADQLLNNHEYTFDAYTYFPDTGEYRRTGGSSNPWRERGQEKFVNTTLQGQISYQGSFGLHAVGGTLVGERLTGRRLRNWYYTNPSNNLLTLMPFSEARAYDDLDTGTARSGIALRLNYNFAEKYFIEFLGRRDASYLFPPQDRIGYFPGGSIGWRLSEETFVKNLLGPRTWLSELKLRASYGVTGDDRNPANADQPLISEFAYLTGYNYYQAPAVFNGALQNASVDRGIPITNLSWLRVHSTNIGLDFGLFAGRMVGSVEYFYRVREGLIAPSNAVLIPDELGYAIPNENLNSDSRQGFDLSLGYAGKAGEVGYNIGGNFSFSRGRMEEVFNARFLNSVDRYFNSTVGRSQGFTWIYESIGQFQSKEEIATYPVDIDGRGNTTLLPGDIIYKDIDGDGRITLNDRRPNAWAFGGQPNINLGFSVGFNYKSVDFSADFSGGSGYAWLPNESLMFTFAGDANLSKTFEDRWHREDPFDVNSAWIPGKNPPLRNANLSHSNYLPSDFWVKNVTYFRARTIEVGYTLPKLLTNRVGAANARLYLNTYNLFSIDNMKQYNVDPEIINQNGRQNPQHVVINIGASVSF